MASRCVSLYLYCRGKKFFVGENFSIFRNFYQKGKFFKKKFENDIHMLEPFMISHFEGKIVNYYLIIQLICISYRKILVFAGKNSQFFTYENFQFFTCKNIFFLVRYRYNLIIVVQIQSFVFKMTYYKWSWKS